MSVLVCCFDRMQCVGSETRRAVVGATKTRGVTGSKMVVGQRMMMTGRGQRMGDKGGMWDGWRERIARKEDAGRGGNGAHTHTQQHVGFIT